MDENNLDGVSRDALVALVVELRAIVAQRDATIGVLQKRIATLEQRLTERGGSGMPGTKAAAPQPKPPPRERKKRARGFGRSRLAPTETVPHAVATGPDCGTGLVGGWVQRTREVLEIPVVAVWMIAHQYLARECPLCHKRHVPPVALEGGCWARGIGWGSSWSA